MSKENYNNGINVTDVLSNDETVLWQGRPNKKAYISSLAISLLADLLIVAVIAGVLFLFLYIVSFNIIACIFIGLIAGVFLFGLITTIIKLVPEIIEVKNIEYVVTDKRVLYKSGVIGMDYNSLLYTDVNNVNVNVGILDKLFKVGSIRLLSNGSSISIHCINNCYDLYKQIYKIVLDIQTDIKYPNSLRPDNNPGYKTKYNK